MIILLSVLRQYGNYDAPRRIAVRLLPAEPTVRQYRNQGGKAEAAAAITQAERRREFLEAVDFRFDIPIWKFEKPLDRYSWYATKLSRLIEVPILSLIDEGLSATT